ncbi:MBL fold metallo-hydrolase [Limoniibacter endophyticus]|uniref:MBL fold metallo-hydrolase n=1 Tax=Limoniibacter endophyticus TaxID=1565040 RepID=A0A8J3DH36_9HYPH|nr:MBL fold metallo-hydrolase [Limoniibacter endophyticus]GHC67040.1 MBL fold metallo-hydrolase [Limoniibacter endophyticus]
MEFVLDFKPDHGQPVQLENGIRRITAKNPSAFTFQGTNSYIIGTETLAVIDPGPADEAHLTSLLKTIDDRPVSHIFVSHTHADHSTLAPMLARKTGAVMVAIGPHKAARALHEGEVNRLEASADTNFTPDVIVEHHDLIEGDGWALQTVFTPGHCANHAAFALVGTGVLFSADHVMAWATSIVAPPDGSMTDYMDSLDRLLEREDRIYYPGHGGPVLRPKPFVRAMKTHRRMRESAIVERLKKGDRLISDMVKAIYRDTDPRLHGAAALSVFAHLEDLVERGIVSCEGVPALDAVYSA